MVKFGTGGWRAIIGDEFTKENVQILAKAMVDKIKSECVQDKEVVLGYDKRFLSKEAMQWTAQVFAAENVKTLLINKSAPTPLVMYYVMVNNLDYGMMITASHNPALYNGVKVFTKGGRDADEQQTIDIEEYIGNVTEIPAEEMDYDEAVEQGLIKEIYPENIYIDNIIENLNMKAIRDAEMKIAFDPMYGVSETSLKTIFFTARCHVETINDNHDTLFGGRLPAPTAETLRRLQTCVIDHKCHIGIATDGDADRLGVIDDRGRFLHPNDILVILYYYLVKYKGWKGPVVRNICTTHMLDKIAALFGQECFEVPVGFKHISAKMYSADAVIGGESSGGLTVRGHIKGKDGIYAASLLVEMIAVTGKKLSEIVDEIESEIGTNALDERDYKFTQNKKEAILKVVMEEKLLPEFPFPIEKVSYLDGCKVYFKNGGWAIARFSGTEPLLRTACEMPNAEDAKKVCDMYEEFLGI